MLNLLEKLVSEVDPLHNKLILVIGMLIHFEN